MNPLSSAASAVLEVQKAEPQLRKLQTATQELEAVFMKKLLGEMQKGTSKTHFGESMGGEMYQDMFNDAVSQSLSKQGALGIAKMLYKPMARQVMAGLKAQAMAASTTTKEN